MGHHSALPVAESASKPAQISAKVMLRCQTARFAVRIPSDCAASHVHDHTLFPLRGPLILAPGYHILAGISITASLAKVVYTYPFVCDQSFCMSFCMIFCMHAFKGVVARHPIASGAPFGRSQLPTQADFQRDFPRTSPSGRHGQ